MTDQEPEMEIVHLLRRVTVEFGLRQAEFAVRNGMHPTDVRALICLLDAGRTGTDATAGWLGAQLGINSAGTTSLIDRLEHLGHLGRTRDPRDRRRVLLSVTPRAVELGRSFFAPLIDSTVAVLRGFDEGETAAVRSFLHTVHQAVTAPPPSAGGPDGAAGTRGTVPRA
ncbi:MULTISPECIES: MarR family transcriptional regulator [unclassified Streptomyces]|uniref:MarR family transcriptional regulator n=1 Tax=unclassified Streptomyces TaxID=2593676 RepID=UPI0036E20783